MDRMTREQFLMAMGAIAVSPNMSASGELHRNRRKKKPYPASFYTGPLRDRVPLPRYGYKYLGSAFGGVNYSKDEERTQALSRQSAMGRTYDVWGIHYGGDLALTYEGVAGAPDPNTVVTAPTQEAYAIAQGSIPYVSWTPGYSVADCSTGSADAIWEKMATYWSQYAPTIIMLRPYWEFDIPIATWGYNSATSGTYSAATFIAAWKRMVEKISAKASNVGFHWCPHETAGWSDASGGTAGRAKTMTYYPGENWVDWVGTDVYNPFLTSDTIQQSSPLHAGWAQWWEIFNYGLDQSTIWSHYDMFCGVAVPGQRGYVASIAPKPFFFGETSSIYDSGEGLGSKKGDWFENIVDAAKGVGSLPHCIGGTIFDEDVNSASDFDWRVDRDASVVDVIGNFNQASLDGFVAYANKAIMFGR